MLAGSKQGVTRFVLALKKTSLDAWLRITYISARVEDYLG